MGFLLFGCRYELASCNGVLLSISPSAQGADSLQLSTAEPCCSHHRNHHHCILQLTKTRASPPPGSQRVHLHVVGKQARYYSAVFRRSRSLGLRSTPVLSSSHPRQPFPLAPTSAISRSFVCPLLATTACVLVAKEEKQPFKGLGLRCCSP